jgi:hypothetical protein
MKRLMSLALMGLLMLMTAGCGHWLTASECLLIHDGATQAADNFRRADADPNVPVYAKMMIGGHGLILNNLDARINNKGAVDANTFKPKTAR